MAIFGFEAFPRALDANGDPISGGKLLVWTAGTTTPVTLYQDLALSTPHASPLIADADGFFPNVYLPAGKYKIRVTDADDALIFERDDVPTATLDGATLKTSESAFETAGAKRIIYFDNLAALLADVTVLSGVAEGTFVRCVEENAHYKVAALGDDDNDIVTTGGVKLYRQEALSIAVTVGATGDYTTLNAALEALSKQKRAYKKGGVTATVTFQSGFVLAEEVHVVNDDLQWVTLLATDASVTVTRSAITTNIDTTYDAGGEYNLPSRVAVFYGYNAKLPTIGCLFVMDESGDEQGIVGILATRESEVNVLNGCGFTNVWPRASLFDDFDTLGDGWTDNGDGTWTCDGSQASASSISETVSGRYTVSTEYLIQFTLANVTAGAINRVDLAGVSDTSMTFDTDGTYRVSVTASDADGNTLIRGNASFAGTVSHVRIMETSSNEKDACGINVSHCSSATGWGSVWSDNDLGIRVSNRSDAGLRDCTAQRCRRAVNLGGPSSIALQDGDLRYSVEHAINADDVANIHMGDADVRYSGAGGGGLNYAAIRADGVAQVQASGVDFTGCGRAVDARDAARVNVTGATIVNTVGDGLHAADGARIVANDATITGAGGDGVSADGGTIIATGATITGSSSDDISVTNGGEVRAHGAQTSNGVAGPPKTQALADMSISPNRPPTADGQIWCDLVTEARGNSQVDNGSTSVDVTHGLATTPNFDEITITQRDSLGSASEMRVSAAGSTTFTVTVDTDPGKNVRFGWQAINA